MHRISGRVIQGKMKGRELGYPTANISLDGKPLSGIYAGKVSVEDTTYLAGIYADKERDTLEAYLIDYIGELYGETIDIEVHDKLRDSKTFTSDSELKEQIARDINDVRLYFDSVRD